MQRTGEESSSDISNLLWKILSNDNKKKEIVVPGILSIQFLKEGNLDKCNDLTVIVKQKSVLQILIDHALCLISTKLIDELFEKQKNIQEEVEKKISKIETEKLTHKEIDEIIFKERKIFEEVKEWQNYFLEIFQYAESMGLYVHKRERGCIYSLYKILRIDFVESVSISIQPKA